MRTSATATGASSTRASGSASLPGDSQHPELGGLNFRQISERLGKDPWECYLDILADAGPGYEAILTVGTLFTDEHWRR